MRYGLCVILRGACLAAKFCESFLLRRQQSSGQPMAGASTNLLDTIHERRLDLWFADFPTADWPAGSTLTFTFFWKRDQRWEGRDWQVKILDT